MCEILQNPTENFHFSVRAVDAELPTKQAVHTVAAVFVSLAVPPEDPVVDGSPELLLMAGTPYNLTCVTRGAKPAAHIQWTKDGAAVEGAYHSTVGLHSSAVGANTLL